MFGSEQAWTETGQAKAARWSQCGVKRLLIQVVTGHSPLAVDLPLLTLGLLPELR